MLLRHRPPSLDKQSSSTAEGFGHLAGNSAALLRWLNANKVEFVLVGPVAEAIRATGQAAGPVAIVPAPYHRNYARLCRALLAAHARVRVDGEESTTAIKLTEDKLVRGGRWTLRCGVHDLDIEGRPEGAPSYQELLYEAAKITLADDLTVDVAAPEDLEHYAHVRRTGSTPEIRITRNAAQQKPAETS